MKVKCLSFSNKKLNVNFLIENDPNRGFTKDLPPWWISFELGFWTVVLLK
jgi:hypothetical protein